MTLDDFMRAMWRAYGKPGGAREGYVDRPYSLADAEARLAEVSGDPALRASSSRATSKDMKSRITLACSAPLGSS